MPKSKKARIAGGSGDAKKGNNKKMHMFPRLSTSNDKDKNKNTNTNMNINIKKNNYNKKKGPPQQKNQRPIVPFGRLDRILLIGEGDFSFARSLVVQHGCKNVLATCYDSKDDLEGKYPQVEGNIRDIHNASLKKNKKKQGAKYEKEEESKDVPGGGQDEGGKGTQGIKNTNKNQKNQQQRQQLHNRHGPKTLFSVDARKLGHATVGGGKDIRNGFPRPEPRQRPAWKKAKDAQLNKTSPAGGPKGGPWDIICFNFPHVGGLSTDVNRQVRANQELLVAFFKACVPLLSVPSSEPVDDSGSEVEDELCWEGSSSEDGSEGDEEKDDDAKRVKNKTRTQPGQVLVTLFEGEPYTLWNIKDLARHAGLRVVTSFRFSWASYEGYSHARTLGHINGKHGGQGGWKGEDRDARMYVFEVNNGMPVNTGAKKKRARDDDTDSDNSD